jgi:hypothetical protein
MDVASEILLWHLDHKHINPPAPYVLTIHNAFIRVNPQVYFAAVIKAEGQREHFQAGYGGKRRWIRSLCRWAISGQTRQPETEPPDQGEVGRKGKPFRSSGGIAAGQLEVYLGTLDHWLSREDQLSKASKRLREVSKQDRVGTIN